MTADLDAATEKLFRAAEAGDWETFSLCFAPDAVLAQNIGTEQPIADALVSLPTLTADGTTLRYDNVRRFVGDQVVTELHDAIFTKPDGREVCIDICVVIQFDDAGLIVRSDEYLDSRAARALVN